MKITVKTGYFKRLNVKVALIALSILFLGLKGSALAEFHPLRIGLTGVIVQENLSLNKPLIQYIGDKLRLQAELILRDTYQEMNDMLEKREVDIAFVCSPPYIIGKKKFELELLVVPQINGEPMYFSYVIVPKDSNAKRLEDLRGKRYAYSDPLSNSGSLAPRYKLAKIGESPESFFKMYVYTRSHYNSIEAVAMKLVDGASVDSYVWELANATNPIFTSKTKIIEKGPVLPFTPFVIRKGIDPTLKERIREVFLNMHLDPEGSRILDSLKIDRFVAVPDSFYNPIRERISYVENYMGKEIFVGR